MTSRQVPVSQMKLFLGKGFYGSSGTLQRLLDTLRPEVARYVNPFPGFIRRRGGLNNVRNIVFRPCAGYWQASAFNPVRPLPPVGGLPALHGIELDETNVLMDLRERVGHLLVLGTTRVGRRAWLSY